jgi:CheY-like chemotaxis protein
MGGTLPMFVVKDASKNNPKTSAPVASGSAQFWEASRKKRILHVEFDRSLLTTRHALLETAGFDVISCFSGVAAREVSAGSIHFDLFLLGHAASLIERADLVTWARTSFPKVPIVVLRSRDTDGSPAADANAIADPEELLTVIVDILKLR